VWGRVPESVRQRLLHDPVGGQVDAWRQFSRLAFDRHSDRQSGGLHLVDQPVELLQGGLWRERELVVACAQHADQAWSAWWPVRSTAASASRASAGSA
jgi:hypothetical protein